MDNSDFNNQNRVGNFNNYNNSLSSTSQPLVNDNGLQPDKLGYSPATQIGQTSLADSRVPITGMDTFLNYFQPQGITNANLANMSIDKITTGTLFAAAKVGSSTLGGVTIDGVNQKIVVNDGVTDRILIGRQVGGF